jgi:hypothetical protein
MQPSFRKQGTTNLRLIFKLLPIFGDPLRTVSRSRNASHRSKRHRRKQKKYQNAAHVGP